MHANFSRRVVAVCSSSLQRTNLLTKPRLSHPSQSRHFLSYVLPSGISSYSATSCFVPSLLSRKEKIRGFFANTLGNTYLKLKFGNLLESRVGFFGFELPLESGGFTGFQKRGWKSWFNGANGAVFGLIIANVSVLTMWWVAERQWKMKNKLVEQWMIKNFVLTKFHLMRGRIHTLITSGFSHIGFNHFITNMLGLFYFGTRIARTLGPVYLLKLYFAGSLGSAFLFLSNQALMGTSLKSSGFVTKDPSKPANAQQGAEGSVYAIMLLDIFLYPRVTTYFGLLVRVPAMATILLVGYDMLRMLEGQKNRISSNSGHLGGFVVAAMAWAMLRRKGRFC